ncbi:MAG TPA: bifunctional demethylmenaquinone methyltransferase/2-methoxy-6-polyprenyl-1,4-benzoquinol methylase UbiE [Planctomycetaceae bacterium]|nr:bifunctional demethylmenaquinone methyltransferase/2-methoxy-6-polyprenyl-1,4-benzoquinol methylase UbiE [Planctomycetaceae bacterium]HRF01093.1 bifunctional demethylmenaquinone methyltransferase/2-methoxy-6-polyprenyl-1,4-benzoquinol methylase UbiE [Pirellulaceae bacterium]
MNTAIQPPPNEPAPAGGVDKSDGRVRAMFGEIAPKYDRMNHLLSMQTDRYWRWWTVRRLAPHVNGPVLDLCTGTGDLALAFDAALGGRQPVIGADFCHPMLAIGRAKGAKRGGRVRFVHADAQRLPFPDASFDLVTVAFGLRNVADTDLGLREIARVCRPGGRMAVLEFTMPRFAPLRVAYAWYFRNVLPRIGQLLARNRSSAYEYLPSSVGEFPMYQELADRMTRAGWSDVRFRPLTFGVATLYEGVRR